MPKLSIAYFSQRLAAMIALLTELVEIESPTTVKNAVDTLGLRLKREAEALGARVEVFPRTEVGDILACRWNATGTANPEPGTLLLLGHLDTVHDLGRLASWPISSTAEELRGPGVLDMKGGIVLAFEAVRALQSSGQMPSRPITLLLTSDEETGSLHSRDRIEAEARKAAMVFCLEPALANGALKTWRKGTGDIRLRVRGVAAHAGVSHELGRNAIEELAHHILVVQRLTNYDRGTTVNVGVIRGGTRPNVVPDSAEAEIDFRILDPGEILRLQAWVDGLQALTPGTSVSAALELNRPPMPRDAAMIAAFEKARAIGAQLGLALEEGGTGGGSDANFVAPLGVPVLDGLGPLGDGAHSEREFVRISSLPERAALLAALLAQW